MDRKETVDYKSEIKRILSELKSLGYDRRAIERGLGCRELYIDQVLSRGGNKIFLASISQFLDAKKQAAAMARSAHAEDIILALQVTVHVMMQEIIDLKAIISKTGLKVVLSEVDRAKISKEVEKKTQLQRELLLRDHRVAS